MAKATEIEKRTDDFIREFNRLKINGLIVNNEDVAEALGYSSGASISEILGRRQNIPGAKWKIFKEKYGIASDSSEGPSPDHFSAEQIFALFLEVSKAQTAILNNIESKMARGDTQATMDANLKRTLAGVLTLSKDHEDAMKEIRDLFLQAKIPRKGPSRGGGKGRGQTDGRSEKTGKNPA